MKREITAMKKGAIGMKVREKRTIGKGPAAALLLVILVLLMPGTAAYAADDDNGIDLIEHPSIPVIVLHIDETQGGYDR